jgi:hypothetical protein
MPRGKIRHSRRRTVSEIVGRRRFHELQHVIAGGSCAHRIRALPHSGCNPLSGACAFLPIIGGGLLRTNVFPEGVLYEVRPFAMLRGRDLFQGVQKLGT